MNNYLSLVTSRVLSKVAVAPATAITFLLGHIILLDQAHAAIVENEVPTFEWIQQFGTTRSDSAHSVAADGLGNVYVSGQTSGNLGGDNAGSSDAFLSKFDSSGGLLWSQQLGTTEPLLLPLPVDD